MSAQTTDRTRTVRPGGRGLGSWLALALLLGGLLAPLALAGPAEAKRGAEHCAVLVQEGRAEPKDIKCFDRFADAVAEATGGRVRLDSDAKPSDLTDRVLERGRGGGGRVGAQDQGTTVLGIAYDRQQWFGDSFLWFSFSTLGCRAVAPGQLFLRFTIPTQMNNRAESARSFQGCRSTYHDGSSFSGTSTGRVNDPATLGSMNNRASSVSFTRV